MAINQDFKKMIDKIKYKFSINQAQIAERLGVKSTYLSDMINSRVPYNNTMQKRIYEIFHIKIEDCSDETIEVQENHIKQNTKENNISPPNNIAIDMNNPTAKYFMGVIEKLVLQGERNASANERNSIANEENAKTISKMVDMLETMLYNSDNLRTKSAGK